MASGSLSLRGVSPSNRRIIVDRTADSADIQLSEQELSLSPNEAGVDPGGQPDASGTSTYWQVGITWTNMKGLHLVQSILADLYGRGRDQGGNPSATAGAPQPS